MDATVAEEHTGGITGRSFVKRSLVSKYDTK